MAHFGIYMYPYNNEVTLGNFNMPFGNRIITLYRGTNNTLSFTVHNADGKYTKLKENEELIFHIYDARSDTSVYEVLLYKTQPSWLSESGMTRPTLGNKEKVYYGCIIPAGILADLSSGTKYRWSIKKVTLDNSSIENTELLYTGLNYEGSGELKVSNDATPTFIPSTELSPEKNTSWISIKDAYRQPIDVGYKGNHDILASTPFKANAQYGLTKGLSTIAFYFKDFIGRIQLQGCLSNDCPIDAENYKWFVINLKDSCCSCSKSYIENEKDKDGTDIKLNGIDAYNFEGHYMWLRVVVLIPPEYNYREPNITRLDFKPFLTVPKILIRR